jgi:hypothetical protein
MFTVALIGPDGVGKTTISRYLEETMPVPAKYVYMGVNVEASNVALPTSRWINSIRRCLGRTQDMGGPLDHAQAHAQPKGLVNRVLTGLKRSLRLANHIAEVSYRQLVVSWYLLRGNVVLLDRDFFADYYAYDIAGGDDKSFTRRLHGFLLKRFYRQPDLFVYLDADPSIMFARKGEGTLELLERRRLDYLELASVVEHFTVVDATRSLPEVVSDVESRIRSFQESKPRADRRAKRSMIVEESKGAQP